MIHKERLWLLNAELAMSEAQTALDRGSWRAVEEPAIRARTEIAANRWSLLEPVPVLFHGRALLGAGHPAEAVEHLEAAVRTARARDGGGTLELARACLRQARALAGDRVTAATAASDPEASAVAAETEAIVALKRGDPATAVALTTEAVDRWGALGATAWLARAYAIRADALGATGDRRGRSGDRRRASAVLDAVSTPAADRPAILAPLSPAPWWGPNAGRLG